jgi:N-acyl homoserine lactone hydrolase
VIDPRSFRFISCSLVLALIGAVTACGPADQLYVGPDPPLPGPVRLYVFECGMISGLAPSLFGFESGELAAEDSAVPCYLIDHPDGNLMWEVGTIPDADFAPEGGPVIEGVSTADRTLASQMAEVGFEPADVTHLAMSHYHSDHTANANLFADAVWLTQRIEREAMFSDEPPGIVNPDHFDQLYTARTVYLTDSDYDVFDDGRVVIKSAPGHTPGHIVLFLDLDETGPVLLSGDLYHYPEERGVDRFPTFEADVEQARVSRAAIEAFLEESGSQLWIEHDVTNHSSLRKAPEFYQ